jgi:hypothetical protein
MSLLGGLAADGAERIRVVTTVPHPGIGAPWDGWCRYEAAINELLGAFPVWGIWMVEDRRCHLLGGRRDFAGWPR